MANYLGIKDIKYIFRGICNDPAIMYKGHLFNYYDIEDPLWENFQDITNGQGTAEEFELWLIDNPYYVTDWLDELIALKDCA